jgi:hypothetical protein
MADYAAVPVQPIAHGLLTINAGGNPIITGRGFASAVRVNPVGDFLLAFDHGVGVADIGSGPGFTVGIIGPNGLDPRFIRASITMRGGTTAPGLTTISSRIVTFVVTPGEGVVAVQITLRNTGNILTDPMGAGVANAAGSGVEIIVWNGNAGPDNAQAALVGPLFQNAFKFP